MIRTERGTTFVEVIVGLLLVSILTFAALYVMGTGNATTKHNLDKQFCTEKAISMLEELKALVQIRGSSVAVLDAYDNGATYQQVLTTDTSITLPGDPVSGNSAVYGGWKYKRLVNVSLLPGVTDSTVRLVKVKVCLDQDDNGDGQPDIVAEVAGVIRSLADPFPTTQVYDVYVLAIENVPGWWVFMANLIPFVQNAIQDLEARNPGMEFRVHWITELGYGRDTQYRPYVNLSSDSTAAINNVYFYPGALPSGSPTPYYYPPDNIEGHILLDATDTNGYDAASNPNPYALADQYNHVMRYPDELALFNARVASGQETDDTPTLRLLLDRMYLNPGAFQNAILINVHGELFPFPPMRNYSDAAKDPTLFPGIRAVTHPEQIRYPNNASTVNLRVYSYRTDPDNTTAATNRDWLGQNVVGSTVPVNVVLKGINWDPVSGSGDILAISGGTDIDGTAGNDPYVQFNATTTVSTNGMYFSIAHAGGDTILSLYNSPLKSPEVAVSGNYGGINGGARLYGLEYEPAPMDDFTGGSVTPFARNLTTTHTVSGGACNGGACGKNSARWIIKIPSSVYPAGATGSEMMTFETRINSTTTGTRTNVPTNLSNTYLWKGTDTWVFGDGTTANPPNLPISEQFQFQGDPRHCPYADLKMPHSGSGLTMANALGMGYNRYFDDFQNSTANRGTTPGSWWQGWFYTVSGVQYGVKNDGTNGNDGWYNGSDYLDMDMNRIFQVIRTVLTRTRSVWTTMTGFSYFYVGVGGEIGYDSSAGFTNSIPINNKPFSGTTGSTYEQSIVSTGGGCTASVTPGCGVKYIKQNTGGNYWWSMNWLGELYPDSAYSTWQTDGNLPTGSASTNYLRALRQNIGVNLPSGTTLVVSAHRTAEEGSTAFYWTGSANSTFHHRYATGTGNLLSGGTDVANNFNYPLGGGISLDRPFDYDVNDTSMNPDGFMQAPYGTAYTAGSLLPFYDHSTYTTGFGSALFTFSRGTSDVSFIAVNGLSPTGSSGSSFIANWSFLSLMHSFLSAGLYNAASSYTNHIPQVPQVTITSPNSSSNLQNPSSITIGWTRSWTRWDGKKYTTAYPSTWTESTNLSYTVMYSPDNGLTWFYMQDDSPATPGVRPASSGRIISSASATPSYTWNTPSSTFPAGNYLIRVEAYRDTIPLHYAYHQYRAFLRRP